jgi:hypothetical protein
MAIGDNTDMWGRLKNLLPVGWFGDNNPIRDALLWGYANGLAWGYTLYLYAKDQTRIKSATDGWLDLIGLDFFGDNLVRYANQSDASYRNRILINIFRERTTRHAMEQVLFDLTGRWPIIVEPARPADVGSYGAAVAVSRASTGTFVDLSGRLATADLNVARYDIDLLTGVGRLLVEEARTNLALRSQEFDNSYWTKTSAVVTTNQILAPDGSLTADKLIDTAVSGNHIIQRSISSVADTTYTWSIFVKAGERKFARIQIGSFAAQVASNVVNIDLTTGAFTATDLSRSKVQQLADGWFKVSTTVTVVSSTSNLAPQVYMCDSFGNINYTGDGVSGLYIWGAQYELGSTPTSYIPTTAATASRAADILLNNMPAGSVAIGGYGVAGSYGSVLLPYQAFITAFRPLGQGLPFVSGYGVSTGAYSTPSRSAYGQLSGGDVTDADIYAAIDATKPIGTVAWTRISS